MNNDITLFPMCRHCEARSAVAIQEDLYGLLRNVVPRNDGTQKASSYQKGADTCHD